ncbi:hypothetical protein PAECIP111802_00610 [Paenibacillus allorhizosphaerae]|uniref:Uncharacterized protein n=1 Tax=Paenibacillus allorhizosphaerae TaxID=2849866 RepID=A0ABN7TEC9_9BACL|nr:hypothetical protein PAECIP111802_00610 [Paenibacillus allorhizosphaerae]
MRQHNREMTRKTKYYMYSGSALYALSIVIRIPYLWRFILLIALTLLLTVIIDEPIKGFLRKLFTVFLFLFFVGTLMGLILTLIKMMLIRS